MGTTALYVDGIVHSRWKQRVNKRTWRSWVQFPAPQMSKLKKKFIAQELRRRGLGIGEIAKELNMVKSGTISKWCRDIPLTVEQIARLVKKQKIGSYKGRIVAAEQLRKNRIRQIEFLRKEGLKRVGKLTERDIFIAGVGMYWSEGYTYNDDLVGFTNSDPKMILFMLRWFKKICGVSSERIRLRVSVNKIHKGRVRKIEKYWSKLTKIPLDQFNKTVLIKSRVKKVYKNSDNYQGTLRITIKNSSYLRRLITGFISGLQ